MPSSNTFSVKSQVQNKPFHTWDHIFILAKCKIGRFSLGTSAAKTTTISIGAQQYGFGVAVNF